MPSARLPALPLQLCVAADTTGLTPAGGRVFCGAHWRADEHACTNPPLQDNRIERPLCPLCSTPVTVESGVDPNIPMDAHFAACPVLDPRTGLAASKPAPAKPANVCRAARCPTKLVAIKISCANCRRDYCVKHRDARDHACPSLDPPKPVIAPKATGSGVKAQPGRVTNSGLAALRRMRETAGPRASTSKAPVGPPKTGPGSSRTQPIDLDDSDDEVTVVSSKKSSIKKAIGMTKEDRRARAERESAQKALERRAAKGSVARLQLS